MRFDAALAAEARDHQTGTRVSTVVLHRDGQQTLACTGDWALSVLFTRYAIEARRW